MDKRSFVNWITKRSSIWTLSLCMTGAIVLGGIAAINNSRNSEENQMQIESELGEYAYLENEDDELTGEDGILLSNGQTEGTDSDSAVDANTGALAGTDTAGISELVDESDLMQEGEMISANADGTTSDGSVSANADGTTSDGSVSANADGTASDGSVSVSSDGNSSDDAVSEAASDHVISEQALLDAGVAFSEEESLMWPSAGTILIDYSMDSSVYFATLNQYKYNPALIIRSDVGNQVIASAKGIVESIDVDDVTGNTLVLNIGNGYKLTYGQLKELAVAEGDVVEEGALLGYVSEPTKYYSVEGSNLYFAMTQNDEAVDPVLYLD